MTCYELLWLPCSVLRKRLETGNVLKAFARPEGLPVPSLYTSFLARSKVEQGWVETSCESCETARLSHRVGQLQLVKPSYEGSLCQLNLEDGKGATYDVPILLRHRSSPAEPAGALLPATP